MHVFLIYEKCCFYEIMIAGYFLKYTGQTVRFISLDGAEVTAMEGFRVCADAALSEIDPLEVRSVIVPGGEVSRVRGEALYRFLQECRTQGRLVAGICAGVDLLEEAGVLDGVASTHSCDEEFVRDGAVITARANAYVDFAVEIAKYHDLFEDEANLQETIDFWKYHKRME